MSFQKMQKLEVPETQKRVATFGGRAKSHCMIMKT